MNIMTAIDGYKLDHRRQYPPGTQKVYSNWTPRSSRTGESAVVFFGLQYLIAHYLEDEMRRNFFEQPKAHAVNEYKRRLLSYVGDDAAGAIGTDHIAALHDLQYLPLKICALPEGSIGRIGLPMLTIENTHDDFFWLVNYFETLISSILWMPCTSATTAARYRGYLDMIAKKTGTDPDAVQWQAHDFSFRGMPGLEAAQLSGAGHLLSFRGTDSIPAIDFLEKYYGPIGHQIGGSVPATEHSVMCAGGKDGELETISRLLDLYPTGVLSIVSDTWDLWNVVDNILPKLKDKILARNGKLVIRPDSGDPVEIICGITNPKHRLHITDSRGIVERLWRTFGGSMTDDKGYAVLNPHIGVIYGDSITYERCEKICKGLMKQGFAPANVVFGIGSYTYQYVTRDTYGFAMKATWVKIDGKGYNIFKKPATDTKREKTSATGRLAVLPSQYNSAPYNARLVEDATYEEENKSLLKPVWTGRDGFHIMHDLTSIRNRLHPNWKLEQ